MDRAATSEIMSLRDQRDTYQSKMLDYKQQRDDLLAALEKAAVILEAHSKMWGDGSAAAYVRGEEAKRIREAIARAKGETPTEDVAWANYERRYRENRPEGL